MAAELMERISERVGRLKIGPGSEPDTTLGPVVSQAQPRISVDAHCNGTR